MLLECVLFDLAKRHTAGRLVRTEFKVIRTLKLKGFHFHDLSKTLRSGIQ